MVAIDFENDTASRSALSEEEAAAASQITGKRQTTRSLAEQLEIAERDGRSWRLHAEQNFLPLKNEEAEGKKRRRRNEVQKFYHRQNAQIDEFVSMEREMEGDVDKGSQREAEELAARQERGVKGKRRPCV